MKKYVVKLTVEERAEFERVIKKGKAAAWKVQRAWAMLRCDQSEDGSAWSDEQIAAAFGCTTRSLENWRKRAVEFGPLSLLERASSGPRQRTFDGEQEARLTQLACSQAPSGRARWTLRLLAEQMVELQIVEAASHETVRRTLKKVS